ncbi:MAG: phosphonate ABC transporter, permease protein PhnE [Acetobacteraceae bacterium]
MSGRLRDTAVADLDGLRDRHASVFKSGPVSRLITLGVLALLIGLVVLSLVRLDFSLARILSGVGELGRIVALMVPPVPASWDQGVLYLHALAETVAIAFLGTLMGAVFGFPLALLAARNTTINRVVQFLARRSSDTVRGIDQLIWALIWVNVVGLGPFAGMLAVMTSDIGNLSKLFGEAIETADRKPVEGILASGGTKMMAVRFGILPQVLPVIASQALYFFESNTRSSTIIGIVGAGGIGLHLAEQIRTLEFQAVAFIILLILAAVIAIDFISGHLRHAITGQTALTR